ncbi:MAG: hypothetical protein IKB01_01340 [Lachnospiraceae bacterium]|nr:hypothetical protein [Lachnospiraceae bacterium]
MLNVNDTIKCSSKEELLTIHQNLAMDNIQTDFMYEKDGQAGLWLVVLKIGE